ncbi:M15 family metallopeptidase [Amaricoccus sp. W119]|uniref:M15 family metallopeptidase n=1 Tax=Amaricoccus sp. W119 TaxID=3391833 RepID=UPI0039A556D4
MRTQGLLGAVVIGASIVLAAIAFALVGHLLRAANDTGPEAMLARVNHDLDAQEARIGALEQAVEALRDEVEILNAPSDPHSLPPSVVVPARDQFGGAAPIPEDENLVEGMRLATARFNRGIERPMPESLRALLGEPRDSYSDACQPVTNPKLLRLLETRQIGPFRVTMVRPALDSLAKIMADLEAADPAIHAALGTAGALCARHVRGAPGSVSSHAWGMAIDLTLAGDLDQMGDKSTQFGLVVLAEFFNAEGWYWGAGYGREDSMHFEPGEALLRDWHAQGLL